MVIADWFSETAGHWCMPEWWLGEQAILTSFSYQAVASFFTIAVPTTFKSAWASADPDSNSCLHLLGKVESL